MTEPARTTTYKIGAQSLRQRTQNVLYGAGLSLLLLLLVGWGHLEQPQTYNDVLLWSVVGFVVLANAIGFRRHRRSSSVGLGSTAWRLVLVASNFEQATKAANWP